MISQHPGDIDALNRLARAHAELGNIKEAKKTAEKVLSIDQFNKIAQRCFDKWKELKSGPLNGTRPISASIFLEEPGKTKIISLLHPGAENVLAQIETGDELKFITHAHRVNLLAQGGEYVGRLPDDLAAKIKLLLSRGYNYKIITMSADKKEVKIFIRETFRPKDSSDLASFPGEKLEYNSHTTREFTNNNNESPLILPTDEY
ncbi:tetratricopeptide repeat protein [Candidatus Woesebacteria bacterium]|nr:tetratricopeptide repeat protein [Candidatus Woesebacteria bacterium]